MEILYGGYGVVEDRMDPLQLGRVKVRIYGYHTEESGKTNTGSLLWAVVMMPVTSSCVSGMGSSPTDLVEGATVLGFFMDGHGNQNPVIIGSLPGKTGKKSKDSTKGFKDNSGVYPRFEEEEDTNRLARGKTANTVVEWRKNRVDKAKGAFGKTFEEPKTPYAAKYPYNSVRESEPCPGTDKSKEKAPKNSGHIEEVDDTPGAERLYRQHKSGTFEEIHPDGTRVKRMVGKNYTVVEKDDHLHVWGNGNVSIDGTNNILVSGNCNIEIKGNCKEKVHGNYTLDIGGSYEVNVGGSHREQAGTISLNASRIDLN